MNIPLTHNSGKLEDVDTRIFQGSSFHKSSQKKKDEENGAKKGKAKNGRKNVFVKIQVGNFSAKARTFHTTRDLIWQSSIWRRR